MFDTTTYIVKVTAVDFNNKSFDSSPLKPIYKTEMYTSKTLTKLRFAVDSKRIYANPAKESDYVVWQVFENEVDTDYVLAYPGDYIFLLPYNDLKVIPCRKNFDSYMDNYHTIKVAEDFGLECLYQKQELKRSLEGQTQHQDQSVSL